MIYTGKSKNNKDLGDIDNNDNIYNYDQLRIVNDSHNHDNDNDPLTSLAISWRGGY